MEPGIPDPNGRATRLGIYNLDPAVRFWATPPIHGCLRTTGYAHVFPRALSLMSAGKIDVKPLVTNRFTFDDSVEAFDFASAMPPSSVKVQVELPAWPADGWNNDPGRDIAALIGDRGFASTGAG